MPDLAPPSMAMFVRVSRLSIERWAMVSPLCSIAMYRAPSSPISEMTFRIMSLPTTQRPGLPE